MKRMVAEKEERCWRTFCKEHRHKDLWEIVRWAKDPRRLKTRIWNLKDRERRVLSSEEEKVEGLVRDLFGWREGTIDLEETQAVKREWGVKDIEETKVFVEKALIGTKNSSAPGPDWVSYQLIKAVRDTPLGQGVIKEVAESLLEGRTPPEWREMRVVLIPKP